MAKGEDAPADAPAPILTLADGHYGANSRGERIFGADGLRRAEDKPIQVQGAAASRVERCTTFNARLETNSKKKKIKINTVFPK